VHLGGKIMQHLKALRTFSLILGFALVTFGCATSKNQAYGSGFGFTAESVSEGILLTFSNIPSDAIRMTIHVTATDEINHGVSSSMADLRDASFTGGAISSIQLKRVKQSGKVVFPIVQAGKEYTVSAYAYNKKEHELMLRNDENHREVSAHTVIIPENGTFYNQDDVIIKLNNAVSMVNLSSEPVFTSNVTFAAPKYSFGVTIIIPETGSIGVADYHYPGSLSSDGLTWVFEPQMTETLRNTSSWLENGINYSAWANVSANIIFDDIFWCVEIAKTPEFNYFL
jgi:hypothetical protein